MADIVDTLTRSRIMSRIKGQNTKPELAIRHSLFKLGYRYRLHVRGLPARPDIVFPKWKAVIFFHGCFWHRHDCSLFKYPETRKEFWEKKLNGNSIRDKKSIKKLIDNNWRVLVIWECAFRGVKKIDEEKLALIVSQSDQWLQSDQRFKELP